MLWQDKYPEEVNWDAVIPVKPVQAILEDAVERFESKPCLDFMGKIYSYRDVGRMANQAAAGFQRLGVKKGVKVGLFLPNCPQFVAAYFGIIKAGGVVVNFSPLYSEKELLHQIQDSDTDIMVTLDLKVLYPKMAAMLLQSRLRTLVIGNMAEVLPFPMNVLFPLVKARDIARVTEDKQHLSFKELLNNDGSYEPYAVDVDEDVAVLQYTGGTTGLSKGAMLTHANLYANVVQEEMWFPELIPGNERVMGALPFFHVFAMTVVMNMGIHVGAKIIMHPRFELGAVLKDIANKKVTLMPGVPTMYTAILNHPKISDYDLSSIKACLSGGAPLPLEIKQGFETLTGCSLVEGYGLTETSPVACANPINGLNKVNSVGLPMPGTTIAISDKDDPHKLLDQGEIGEICISGPQVMKGYWKRPEVTEEMIIDGRFRTGDVGYLDEDGYTFIIDRIKDLVLVGGFNVYPRNVEEAIYQHQAVAETTVIGIPDEYSGEAVKAFIKLKDNQTLGLEEITSFLKERLGKHEVPKHIEFRDELPKTMIGKLSKKELVEEEINKSTN